MAALTESPNTQDLLYFSNDAATLVNVVSPSNPLPVALSATPTIDIGAVSGPVAVGSAASATLPPLQVGGTATGTTTSNVVQATVKVASTLPALTDTALVVTERDTTTAVGTSATNAVTVQGSASGVLLPVSAVGQGASVEVSAGTVTANTYTAGYVVGTIITFASVLPTSFNGILESITLKFKGSAQTTEFDLVLFSASPSNGTYTDRAAPTWNALDNPQLIGVYPLTSCQSPLGTQTIYNLDGIGKQIVGSSTSLYGVLIAKAACAALGSTSDVSIKLGMIW